MAASPSIAYRIVTPRLVLRCFSPTDAPLVSQAIEGSLDHLKAFLPWAREEPLSLDERVELLRRFRGQLDLGLDQTLGIFSPDEREVLGGVGLHDRVGPGARELGYWVRADVARRGIASEAAAALTQIAMMVQGNRRVEIHCDPRNVASAAVARKLGFVHEVTRRRTLQMVGESPQDRMVWTMLDEELTTSPAMAVPIEAYDSIGRRLL